MVEKSSEEQTLKYSNAFKAFDQSNNNKIDTKYLEPLLISLGKNPTKSYLKDIIKQFCVNPNSMEFSEFLIYMNDSSFESFESGKEEFLDKFRVFDKDQTGIVTAEEARIVFRTWSEQFSDDEINDLLQDAKKDKNGNIRYECFVKTLLMD